MLEIENVMDPDNNLLNKMETNCCYYHEQQFNDTIQHQQGISLIPFNIRSLYQKFITVPRIEYLAQLKKKTFNIIAISETWLKADKVTDIELDGY